MRRLGATESTFDTLPVTAAVAREWRRPAAAVAERGGRPRRRAMELVIAATANVARVSLVSDNVGDFEIILVDIRPPERLRGN